jgi:NAD(P)-dependent dehydrogenase (short-subunit alcohol dehydrogenase family)
LSGRKGLSFRTIVGPAPEKNGAGGAEGRAGEEHPAADPIGRLGEPEENARCVVFLASDDAGLITDSTISANGGQYMV